MPAHAHALRRPVPQELDIGDQGLHLRAILRQVLAIHAAPHAAIDAIFQGEHLIVHQHGKRGEGRDEGRGERPEPRVEMAVHAGEVVAGVALLRIARALADMRCGIDDQGMAVADDVVLRARRQIGDVARIPIGRPAPDEVAGPNSCCQGGNQRDPNHPATVLHGLFTQLMRGATAAKSITLSSSRLGRAHLRCTTTLPR